MAPRTDRTTRIPSGVASPVTMKGSVFVNLRDTGNLKMAHLLCREGRWDALERLRALCRHKSSRPVSLVARNPKSQTRNPDPETLNPDSETRNPKPGTRNPKALPPQVLAPREHPIFVLRILKHTR